MKLLLPFTIIASLLYASNVEAIWKPAQGVTWNYVLGSDISVHSEKAEVVDVDLVIDSHTIKRFHEAGKKVVCYFSGGTIEKYSSDYRKYKDVSGLVRNTYGRWPDEKWLDFRKEGIKPLITERIEKAIEKKCDAIEVDNLDAYINPDVIGEWSNPITADDTVKFAKWLGKTAHNLGISIGLKNISGLIDRVGDYFDFAINESCIMYNECSNYKHFIKSGKAVIGITYGDIDDLEDKLCSQLNGLGISMIVKSSQKLVQKGEHFDGKARCGSHFKYGYVNGSSSGSESSSKKTTKKTVTKTKKTTTTKHHHHRRR